MMSAGAVALCLTHLAFREWSLSSLKTEWGYKNPMKKLLSQLIGKKFSVYVGGEFERMTDFIGFVSLLKNYSDFFDYHKNEQVEYLEELIREKYGYVDANIFVKLGK